MLLKCQTGYTLRQIKNTSYLLPYGQQIADQKKGIAMNETSVFLWNALQCAGSASLEDLASHLIAHYNLGEAEFSSVLEDVKGWAMQLLQYGMLVESLCPVRKAPSCRLSIAGLSFIGMGIQAPMPEWGAMLSNARTYIRDAWHITVMPGAAIMITILILNIIGDGLRDALDPRMKN